MKTISSLLKSVRYYTCYSIHDDDIMAPPMKRMVISIHHDVSMTTCTKRLSWIIASFASNVDIQKGSYSRTKN